jgi:hypothetical protein
VARLERAFELVVAAEPIRRKLQEAEIEDVETALEKGVISELEAARLRERKAAVHRVSALPNAAEFSRSFATAERSAHGFASRISSSFAGIARSLGPLLGLTGAVGAGGFVLLAKQAIEFGDSIAKAADKAALGTDADQALQLAALALAALLALSSCGAG